MDRRRTLLSLAALSTAALLPAARGQALSPKPAQIGLLFFPTSAASRERREAFVKGMRALGHVDGVDVRFLWRYADAKYEALGALAQELAEGPAQVLVADGSFTGNALKQVAGPRPIVVCAADDPVASRFAKSLERPEGTITGLSSGNVDALVKSGELLASVMAKGAPLAILGNHNNANFRKARARVHHAAQESGRPAVFVDANNPAEFEEVFAKTVKAERIGGIVVMSDPMYYAERARLVKAAAAARVPVIYPERAFVHAGGLMSHGPDLARNFERAARYVDRLVKGESAAAMAIGAPGEAELVVNRGTARQQGVTLPQALLAQAKVIGS